jgi:hypothetical protein
MLQVFYLDVVYVCNIFLTVFASVLETYFKGFICLFYMLQVLHMNVSKVDRVLHIRCTWEARGCERLWRRRRSAARTSNGRETQAVRAMSGQRAPMRGRRKTDSSRGRPSKRLVPIQYSRAKISFYF